MIYKIFNDDMSKIIAEVEHLGSAHTFAGIYSKGSVDRPSCNVWVYQPSEDFDGEIAISYYCSGTRFDRVSDE